MNRLHLIPRICIGTMCLLIVAAILFPVFAQTKTSRKSPCISNLKQVGVASIIYMDDHDQRLPHLTWWAPLYPYTKNWDLYECPDVRKAGKRYGHAMNVRAVGRDSSKVKEPTKFIIFFDTDALGRDVIANLAARAPSRHGKGFAAVRLDSSAKFYPYDGPEPYNE